MKLISVAVVLIVALFVAALLLAGQFDAVLPEVRFG